MDMKLPEGMLGKLKMLPTLAEVGKYFPKSIPARQAACKQVIRREDFSVLDFPVLQCWPMDGGRFITLPLVVTRDPRHGKRNVGMYRMQVYDAPDHRHALAASKGGGGALPRAAADGRGSKRHGKSHRQRVST